MFSDSPLLVQTLPYISVSFCLIYGLFRSYFRFKNLHQEKIRQLARVIGDASLSLSIFPGSQFLWEVVLVKLYSKIEASSDDPNAQKKYVRNTVSEIVVAEKNKNLLAYLALVGFFSAIYYVFSAFGVVGVSWSVTILLLSVLCVLYGAIEINSYRLAKGYYGNNTFEALEVIKFVQSHSNTDDFFDSKGVKEVFSDFNAELSDYQGKQSGVVPNV